MPSTSDDRMIVTNPSTGRVEASYPRSTAVEIEASIAAANSAFERGRLGTADQRAVRLLEVAALLRSRSRNLADLMAREMGKPVTQGAAEVEKCAWACEYFAENAPAFLDAERVDTDARESYVVYRPLGVILAVMPWNFPFWQVIRCAAPALMAGNTVILKHASNVPGCALAIRDVIRDAGFEPGHLETVLVGPEAVPDLLADARIRGVAVTGSTAAGRSVAAEAGRNLKKSVLELGGSDPYVILEDADIEHAAEVCATSRLINSGQSCIAAKRFIVVESVRARFEAALVQRMAARVTGDPEVAETDVGPLAREDLRSEIHAQVVASLDTGARALLGGGVPEGPGVFYPPTVLTDVVPGMPAFDKELFGPVAAIVPVSDTAAAIAAANASSYGLGAAVFTRDVAAGERIARDQLVAGNCFVNDMVRSDPRLPFGGVKDSGYGRELARHGLLEFTNAKTVWVA